MLDLMGKNKILWQITPDIQVPVSLEKAQRLSRIGEQVIYPKGHFPLMSDAQVRRHMKYGDTRTQTT